VHWHSCSKHVFAHDFPSQGIDGYIDAARTTEALPHVPEGLAEGCARQPRSSVSAPNDMGREKDPHRFHKRWFTFVPPMDPRIAEETGRGRWGRCFVVGTRIGRSLGRKSCAGA